MNRKEQQKPDNDITQQAVGRQEEIDLALNILGKRKSSSVAFIGEPGTGKTAIFREVADLIASDKDLPNRLDDFVTITPFNDEEVRRLVTVMVDKSEKVPAERKEEAKALMQEVIAQDGGYVVTKGMRFLRPILNAIAEVSSAPDMRQALAVKYPIYIHRESIKSGERLAESFTGGTADKTQALKPFRLKSRGVGFFSLN